IVIPIGKIAAGRWHWHLRRQRAVKARLVNAHRTTRRISRPVGLETYLLRQAGVGARLVEAELHPGLGGVTGDEFDHFQTVDHDTGVLSLQNAGQPVSIDLVEIEGKPLVAGGYHGSTPVDSNNWSAILNLFKINRLAT